MISIPKVAHTLGAVLLVVVVAGCQRIPVEEGLLEETVAEPRLSSHQLRVLVNDVVLRYAGQVEETSDQILAQTTDSGIRRNALLWKINGTSACFRAAMRQDPLAAYLDVWILTRQSIALFESPGGSVLFGPWQGLVIARCRGLEREVAEISVATGIDIADGEQFVAAFSRDYPVSSLYFDRESLASRYIERVKSQRKELMQLMGSVDENLSGLQKLMAVYAEHLPKQARWQAELLLIESSNIATVAQPLRDVAIASQAIADMGRTTNQLPDLVRQERTALQQTIHQELMASMQEFDRMRMGTLAQLEQERAIVLDAVRTERNEIGAHIESQVGRILQQTDTLTRDRTSELAGHGGKLIDHFFVRVAQLLVFIGVSLALLMLIIRRFGRRSTRGAGSLRVIAGRVGPDDDLVTPAA